jgi:hypothetical protein
MHNGSIIHGPWRFYVFRCVPELEIIFIVSIYDDKMEKVSCKSITITKLFKLYI